MLIVQHAEHEHPAVLRRALESQGILTLWLHPYRGENYPDISEISGVISLGGPMGANDQDLHLWIAQECELLRQCVLSGLPTVGICLGGQMIAKALGGRVEKHSTAEVGWFPIELNELGQSDPILSVAGPNPTVYHWHEDTFHLPPGAELLAESQACPRQAFRMGQHAYGFQFHPEADHQLINEWFSIEGIEEEIQAARKSHGPESIQDAETQANHALKGEKASLKITAAIGSLFRKRKTERSGPSFQKQFERWLTQRQILIFEFEGSHRKAVHIEGRVVALLSIPAGEFVIIQELNSLQWPVRLDDIKSVCPVIKD